MLNDKLFDLIVALIKKKPGKESLTEEELKDSIERATIEVSRFCRMRVLVEDLKYILADMAADIYDMNNYDPKESGETKEGEEKDDFSGRVKMLKQGDTTIEFETTKEVVPLSSMSEIKAKYLNDLMPYRSIYWR